MSKNCNYYKASFGHNVALLGEIIRRDSNMCLVPYYESNKERPIYWLLFIFESIISTEVDYIILETVSVIIIHFSLID